MSPKIANVVNGGLKSRILRSNFLFSLTTIYLGDPILNITEPPVLSLRAARAVMSERGNPRKKSVICGSFL